MAFNYTTALARLRVAVADSGSLIWSDGDLQSGIRFALADINLYSGQAYTLDGLDSAAATTLPTLLEGVLVLGAGGYAAMARAVDRAESYELANEGSDVKSWALETLRGFRDMLDRMYPPEQTRTASQKAAAVPPWGAWSDDFGEVGKDETA